MKPVRKPARLSRFDYSACGTYFVTFCTAGRQQTLWTAGDADSSSPPLSHVGCILENAIRVIPLYYPTIRVDHYAIMPDHVHLLLTWLPPMEQDGRLIAAPTLSRVVGQLKRAVSRKAGAALWQKSFYDHIIRDERDYERVWNYISHNPIYLDPERCPNKRQP